MRQCVHHALDQVRGLGHTERATVGDTTRGLVGMYRVHVHKSMLKVIRAGANMKQAGRKFGWLCGGIECPVIGQRMHAQGLYGTIFISGDLCFDVVVTPKTGAAQILSAVFNPLDGLTRSDRCNYCAHISWIDRYLVAKAAADIRRDNADTVLR